jgi:serine/threonine-protein kinase
MDMLLAHATESPPPFAEIGASDWVPPAIEEVVQDCLAKNPIHRPASARDLAERYETALAREQAELEKILPADHPRSDVPPDQEGTEHDLGLAAVAVEDPLTIVHQLEAFMPEKIAKHKLRGFVHDAGGELLESVPGRIKVRLGERGTKYAAPSKNSLSWLGLGRQSGVIEMELQLQRNDPKRDALLQITVFLRPVDNDQADRRWRSRSETIFCDLRGYLMGTADQPR